MKAMERAFNRRFRPRRVFPYPFYYVSHGHRLIYLAIPKNASSFLRAVFLAAHPRVHDFDPKTETAVQYLRRAGTRHVRLQDPRLLADTAYRRLTVLRQPFHRLVSGFLDKFIKPLAAGRPRDLDGRTFEQIRQVRGRGLTPERLCFMDFAETVATLPEGQVDDHYRPQSEFLASHAFDFYGDFANLGTTLHYLAVLGMEAPPGPTRSPKNTRYTVARVPGEHATTPAATLIRLEAYPPSTAFLSEAATQILTPRYQQDLAVYERATAARQEDQAAGAASKDW